MTKKLTRGFGLLLKNQPKWVTSAYPWIIWTIAAGFFFYKYLIQVSPSVMTTDLMRVFQVNAAGLGNLSACYFYAYLIMQIPVGILLDRYSPRLLTSGAIIICSMSTYLFSQTDSFWLASITRALMGFAAAFAAISCFKLASVWFKPERFALISGMFMTAAMLGAVGGQMPLSILVTDYGWRSALTIISVIGLVLGVIYFVVVRDKPSKTHPSLKPNEPLSLGLKKILTNKQAWLLSLCSGLSFAPLSVFGGLWGVPFLEKAYQLSTQDAALASSSIFIGFAIGSPLLGWLSDRMGRRKPLLYLGIGFALISLTVVIYSPTLSFSMIIAWLFLFGFSTSGFLTSFAMIRELFPLALAATVLGVMNTFDSVCEALYEPLVGFLLDKFALIASNDKLHTLSIGNYHAALFLLPLSLLLALISLIFIKETYCKATLS